LDNVSKGLSTSPFLQGNLTKREPKEVLTVLLLFRYEKSQAAAAAWLQRSVVPEAGLEPA
jgi:hypothetical protein